MKSNIFVYISIIIAIVFSACNSTTKEEKKVDVSNAYPEADAVYLKMEKEYTLNPNGSVVYRYSHKLNYLTYLSFNRLYGETFVVYDSDFQNLKINHSVTTMADGKKVPAPSNAFNEILPDFANNFPYFNNIKEMVITHTGLEIGAVVDLDYEIKTKPGYFPFFCGKEMISASSPVKEMIIRVKVPKGTELNFSVNDMGKAKKSESSEGDYKVYTWVFSDVPASSKEISGDGANIPYVQFSTEKMEKISSYLMEKVEYDNNLPEVLKSKADKIIKEGKKGIDLARSLQKMLSKEMSYFNVPINYEVIKARSSDDVWRSNTTTGFELAVMLKKVLKYAGLDAFVTAGFNPQVFDNNTGNFDVIDEFLVRVDYDGELFYLSPVYSNSTDFEYYSNDTDFLIIDKEDKAVLTDKEIPGNDLMVSGELSLSAGSMKGNIEMQISGALNPYYSLLDDEGSANYFFNVNGKAKINEKKKPFSKISLEINQTYESEQNTGYYFIQIPISAKGIEKWDLVELTQERKTDLFLPYKMSESYEFSLAFPENMKVISKEKNIDISNEIGSVKIIIGKSESGLTIKREIKINNVKVTPEKYPEFKALMDAWNNPGCRELVFKGN